MLRRLIERVAAPSVRARLLLVAQVMAAIAAGGLLSAAFPPLETAALAWWAFVPLLTLTRYAPPRRSFWLGGLAGWTFWLINIAWLLRLTDHAPIPLVILGWLALTAYAAVYTAVFAWLASVAWRRLPGGILGRNLLLLAGGPLVWAGFEFLRCRALTGFPWNPLGVSQYRNLPLAQIAEWTGVHGVSALVMLFNISLTLTVLRYVDPRERRQGVHIELALAALLLAVCWRIGMARERRFQPGAPDLHVAVVQTGVPQETKWEEGMVERMFEHLGDQIGLAALTADLYGGRPADLLVLPETVLPYFAGHPDSQHFMARQLDTVGVPILAGVLARAGGDGRERLFNRAALYRPETGDADHYDKQHLVPFGERIPFSGWFPFLERLAPMGWNITPGTDATVFRLTAGGPPFSVTLCFEDAFPYLSRRFARAGARLLINQTNDAWFDPSSASRQHLAQGVFRSIETRLPTVRAANTGISALIERNGRISAVMPAGDAQVAFWRVAPAPEGEPPTLFVRFGDWIFAGPSAILALGLLVAAWRRRPNQKGGPLHAEIRCLD